MLWAESAPRAERAEQVLWVERVPQAELVLSAESVPWAESVQKSLPQAESVQKSVQQRARRAGFGLLLTLRVPRQLHLRDQSWRYCSQRAPDWLKLRDQQLVLS